MIVEAKQALYELLCEDPDQGLPADEIAGYVVKVFRGEPTPGQAPKPSAVTIFTAGVSATDYTFIVRIYVDPSTDAIAMQDRLDATIDALGDLIDTEERFGRSDWSAGYDAQIDALVAQTVVEVGREDFGYSQRDN